MTDKISFKATKDIVDGVEYPAKGTGARHVWDAADEAVLSGTNSSDLVNTLVETTDMSKGTISSQLTYWRKASGKVLAKKVDAASAEKAEAREAAKAEREAKKAEREAEKQRKAEEREATKAQREAEKAEKAEARRVKDEERLAKLQEKIAKAQQAEQSEEPTDEDE